MDRDHLLITADFCVLFDVRDLQLILLSQGGALVIYFRLCAKT